MLAISLILPSIAQKSYADSAYQVATTVLPPDQVFHVEAVRLNQQNIILRFNIAPNYYIYRERVYITTTPSNAVRLDKLVLPHGKFVSIGGERAEEVLTGAFDLNVELKDLVNINQLGLKLAIQGCDGKRICYPPYTYKFIGSKIPLASDISSPNHSVLSYTTPTDLASLTDVKVGTTVDQGQNRLSATSALKKAHRNAGTAAVMPTVTSNQEHNQIQLINNFRELYRGQIDSATLLKRLNGFELFLIFLLAGVAIALTPCMYPLYPIALSAILGKENKTKSRTLWLTLAYIHGVALVYVLIGVLAAFSGKFLLTQIQTPVIMVISAIVVIMLGLAMFDLIEVKLPNRIQGYIQHKSSNVMGGRYTTAFVLGIFSSLILGPCITPPLIITVGFIASNANVLLGVIGLYAIALGIGVPILILATIGGSMLPRSGKWMEIVKHILGSIIIMVGIYLAYPFVDIANPYVSIGLVCFAVTLLFLIIKSFKSNDIDYLMHKLLPIVLLALGLVLVTYGLTQFPRFRETKYLTEFKSQHELFIKVTTKKQLEELIAKSDKPVFLDFYANWCSICREMDNTTFKDEEVQQDLNNYTVIRFDLSSNLPEYYVVMKKYGIYGPPAILIMNQEHQVVSKSIGFVDSKNLSNKLESFSH